MKLLVIGGAGLVGSRFVDFNRERFVIDAPSHAVLDIVDPLQLSEYLKNSPSELVINFSAFTNVDAAEAEKDNLNGDCYKLNVLAVHNLVKICIDLGKHLIHISTDYVFDGTKENSPYKEDDKPNPINWYSRTKLLGEEGVANSVASYTIVRIEMPYSAKFDKKKDLGRFFLETLREGKDVEGVVDQKITPVFVDDAAEAIARIVEKKPEGIYHVASSDWTTPFEFAKKIAELVGADTNLIKPIKFEDFNKTRQAPRPKNTWLDVTKFEAEFGKGILHTNDEAIKLFLNSV